MRNVKAIRKSGYTPDFVARDGSWIIETKGQITNDFRLKWKMLKKVFVERNINVALYMPRNKAQIKKVIELIKQNVSIPRKLSSTNQLLLADVIRRPSNS